MARKKLVTDSVGKNLITDKKTLDGFLNVTAKLGISQDNMSSTGHYGLANFISRNRQELDAAYRGSWLVGRVVDAIAEDMTKDGVTFFSEMLPDEMQKIQSCISDNGVWQSISDAIKWSRLYGGALAVILTDGANYEKPLNINQIGKRTFRGLLVLDRWMVMPSMGDLITEVSKDIGMPKYYQVIPGISSLPGMKIHHSRCLRFDGIRLPHYQKLFENLWGLSVVERMLDRLLAFDSATQGAAQLLYKAHLRVISVEGFREALSIGGSTEDSVIKQFDWIRRMQTSEGITILDAQDKFDQVSPSFQGIAELIDQFATQISGATNIPIVRLFGQSPAGFSTGETDLRNYYDDVNKLQENVLRPQLNKLFEVISRSVLGDRLPEDFEFEFNPLWTLSDNEKSEIGGRDLTTISGGVTAGIIDKPLALKELLQLSRVTGRFTNITDEDIEKAKQEPPEPDNNMMPQEGMEGMGGQGGEENPIEGQPEGQEGVPQEGGEPTIGEVADEEEDSPSGKSASRSPEVQEFLQKVEERGTSDRMDPDMMNMFALKVEEAIDSGNKEEMKRWFREIMRGLTGDSNGQ
jgi:uncharacterized protein